MAESNINSERRKYTKSVSLDTVDTDTSSSDLTKTSSKKSFKQTEKASFDDKKNYSYIEKLNILEKLGTESEQSIIDEYKISDRTLRRWKREREKIEEMCYEENTKDRKKIRLLPNEDLDEAVYLWFCQSRSNGVPVSGPMIKRKALELNKQLGGSESFKASEGWLDKWKSRMKIRFMRIAGEKLSADVNVAENYKKTFAQYIKIRQLSKAEIFNLDETPLVLKSLPVKTFVSHKEDHASGFEST